MITTDELIIATTDIVTRIYEQWQKESGDSF
jgi:hypothetical protein